MHPNAAVHSRLPRWGLACVLVGVLAGTAAAQDPYLDAFERARALEAEGRFAEAADALAAVADDYPEDFDLALQLGWLHFQAERYDAAEPAYRRARELSGGAWQATLGLAWTLLRQGRAEAARPLFETVLERRPDDESAQEGLALATAPPPQAGALHLVLWATLHRYGDHPGKTSAIGFTPQLVLELPRGVVLSGTFRHTRFTLDTDRGHGMGMTVAGVKEEFAQNDGYVSLGVQRPRWGLTAHWGRVTDTSNFLNLTTLAGLTLRGSPVREALGDLVLEASASVYHDETIWRFAPSWRFRPHPRFALVPGGSIQVLDGAVYGMGRLDAVVEAGPMRVWAGARVGDERRPTYFDVPVVFNVADRFLYAATAGLRARLGEHFALYLTYEWQRLEAPLDFVGGRDAEWISADAHFLSVGFGGTYAWTSSTSSATSP